MENKAELLPQTSSQPDSNPIDTPLYQAFMARDWGQVDFLLKHTTIDFFYELSCAYLQENTDYIIFLRQLGITLDTASDYFGNTLFHIACMHNAQKLIRHMTQEGYFSRTYNHMGQLPLSLLPHESTFDRAEFYTQTSFDQAAFEADRVLVAMQHEDTAALEGVTFDFQHYVWGFYFASPAFLEATTAKYNEFRHFAKLAWVAARQSNFFVLRRMQQKQAIEPLLQFEPTKQLFSKEIFLSLCLVVLLSVSCNFQNISAIKRLIEKKSHILRALLQARIDYPPLRTLMSAYGQHLMNIDDGETLLAFPVLPIADEVQLIFREKKYGLFSAFLARLEEGKPRLFNIEPVDFLIILNGPTEHCSSASSFVLILASAALKKPAALDFLIRCFLYREDLALFNLFLATVPHFFNYQNCMAILDRCIEHNNIHFNLFLALLDLIPQFREQQEHPAICQTLLNKFISLGPSQSPLALDSLRTFFLCTVLIGLGATWSQDDGTIFSRVCATHASPVDRVKTLESQMLIYYHHVLPDLFDRPLSSSGAGRAYRNSCKTIWDIISHCSQPNLPYRFIRSPCDRFISIDATIEIYLKKAADIPQDNWRMTDLPFACVTCRHVHFSEYTKTPKEPDHFDTIYQQWLEDSDLSHEPARETTRRTESLSPHLLFSRKKSRRAPTQDIVAMDVDKPTDYSIA